MFLGQTFFVPEKKIVNQKKDSSEILWSEVWKGGFQLMLIPGLLGMYFDAAVVFVISQTLFLRLALAILCNYILTYLLHLYLTKKYWLFDSLSTIIYLSYRSNRRNRAASRWPFSDRIESFCVHGWANYEWSLWEMSGRIR